MKEVWRTGYVRGTQPHTCAGQRAANIGRCVHTDGMYANDELLGRNVTQKLGNCVHIGNMYAGSELLGRINEQKLGICVHWIKLYANEDVLS